MGSFNRKSQSKSQTGDNGFKRYEKLQKRKIQRKKGDLGQPTGCLVRKPHDHPAGGIFHEESSLVGEMVGKLIEPYLEIL